MNCFDECVKLREEFPRGVIKKIFNKHDPWLSQLGYSVEHVKGVFTVHYVIQNDGCIIDPFLIEIGPIKSEEYLENYYKNSEELRMIEV